MKKICLIFFAFISIASAEQNVEYDYELDIYYSNVSMFLDLDSDRNITDGNMMDEKQIYSQLLYKMHQPNIFLIEASVHPMNIAGTYFRKNHESDYTNTKLGNFNMVKALTAGFEEPYSITFFLGRMMVFTKNNGERIGKNRAYMGYMLSVGDKSIKDNKEHNDKWANFEFKLKGTREKENRDLDWSFRIGARVHNNSDFVDTVYVGARRSSIDYDKSIYSFLYNSSFTTMFAFRSDNLDMTEAEIVFGKFIPTKYEGLSVGLEAGYLYTSNYKYEGSLREDGINNHQAILRPNIKWKF